MLARPARPTLEELRAVAQPPEVRGRKSAEHWTADLYLRRLSIHLTRLLVRTPISANGVTALMILAGWCIAGSLLVPGILGPLLAVAFSQLQMYLDCCDGEVARWRDTRGPKGVYLDKVGHYTTESMVALALGLRAIGDLDAFERDPGMAFGYAFAGALMAVFVLLNKAQNDMVHVARAFSGLPRLPDTGEGKALAPSSWAGRLRSLARFVPFHRLFHSVELSLLALAAALVTLVSGVPLLGEHWLVLVLTPAIVVVNVGHFVAIVSSSSLRR